ncbi:uncharacterized protein BKCO1_3000156 [Diplodia corticola]|uniref:Uncharacterized protein n=1 Tax=Diplodia corticola TaxID=236234 RepID=A0A1J9S1X7_9PEZI|nr:uncharacterized protein BKCO1_3000156 [Diplodia corticola]OJD38955.1 hypothetical protein BKCO1_3000156 [Diplodia corticola]
MTISTILTVGMSLLATLPAATLADTSSSQHYRLRAKVTGPQTDKTPDVSGWAIEVRRLGITTRLPPDDMWGVLYNETFSPGRGGDIFYTQQQTQSSDASASYVRTDAPNNSGEVTPFGWYIPGGYALSSDQIIATRTNTAETATGVVEGADGVPALGLVGFGEQTFVACKEAYREWAVVYWTDVERFGTDEIYSQDWRNCTEIQLVPECTTGGPEYEGLVETACVADIGTVL